MLRFLFAAILSCAWACSSSGADQPCTNGSFERLDAQGFPVDWSPVGEGVTVTQDAHDGQRALQLLRSPGTKTPETGLNRGWPPERPARIDQLSGGMDFYYKATTADAAQLMIYVIPMDERNVERTASRRAEFRVPDDHVGDGQWHHGRLKYDFTGDPSVKWVHFAARILGNAGQLLLDDISYVERVGPILRLGRPLLEEDAAAPGNRCTLRVPLWSDGDQPARAASVSAVLPPGLHTGSSPVELGDLAVGTRAIVRMELEGERQAGGEIVLNARADATECETRVALQPRLEVVSAGPTRPLATVGRTSAIECVLKNIGNAKLPPVNVTFSLPTGAVLKSVGPIRPGQSSVILAEFVPTAESLSQEVLVEVEDPGRTEPIRKRSIVVVGPDMALPRPAGSLHCEVNASIATLENEHVRFVFRRLQSLWGPAELYVCKNGEWVLVAQLPRLSRLVTLDQLDQRFEKVIVTAEPPRARIDGDRAELTLQATEVDTDGASWEVTVRLSLGADSDTILASHELRCSQAGRLLAFDGPVLYALDRQEAVFPGLEWLVDDEVSSSTLDIAAGHADQIRYVVHPNMITVPAIGIHASWGTLGLLWDVHQKWDGVHDRPSAVFASPDHFENQRSHMVGLFLPGVPQWVDVNQREAKAPYLMKPDQPLRVECRIVADADADDAISAVDDWIDWQHLPEPAALPHGSYENEVSFSMRGYLDSLWIPDTRQWWISKGGGILSTKGRPPVYVADLLVGAILSPEEIVRRACRDRAAEVLSIIGGVARVDAQRFGARADLALANPNLIAGLVNSRDANGMWAFDADRVGTGPFEGVDYRELGPQGAIEVGTTAQQATQVLKYARIAGDRDAYERMIPTLQGMSAFRVPRAAQVWEVPVHTPDVLAASNAMDAFLEAYQLSGDRRWLEQAVLWARRGLPFIYLWDDPEQPFLVGASIPVFGATWYQGSWFGRPVQWNGLCYACSLLRLAEYDQSRDWRKLAETIIRSGLHQQDQEGENVALWPDNLSAIDGEKCAWVFAPRQILQCVFKLIERDEDPATVILGEGAGRLHVTSMAKISHASWDGHLLQFTAAFPSGEQGCVMVANLTRPQRVVVDGREAIERVDVEASDEPAWRYDPATGFMTIRVTRSADVEVAVHGAQFAEIERLPATVDRVAFEFERSTQGWSAAHDVLDVKSDDGMLSGRIAGQDPYVMRTMLDVPADSCGKITMRIRLTAGRGGQLFWTTRASGAFDEAKSIYLPLQADGEFHELRIDVGAHSQWSGRITGLRIDPGGGAIEGEFAIDYIRGEK